MIFWSLVMVSVSGGCGRGYAASGRLRPRHSSD